MLFLSLTDYAADVIHTLTMDGFHFLAETIPFVWPVRSFWPEPFRWKNRSSTGLNGYPMDRTVLDRLWCKRNGPWTLMSGYQTVTSNRLITFPFTKRTVSNGPRIGYWTAIEPFVNRLFKQFTNGYFETCFVPFRSSFRSGPPRYCSFQPVAKNRPYC